MNTLMLAAIRCSMILLVPALAYAGSAQWNLNPASGDWTTDANWTPMTVPHGPGDIATFALSNTTNVSISANTEVSGIVFTPAATNSYAITASLGKTLTLSGTGITNNSGIAENVVTNGGPFGQLLFTNNATAGNSTIFTNNHGVNNSEGGSTFFFNTSSAGNSMFINENGTVGTEFFGFTSFFDSSTAAHAAFINNGTSFSDYGDGGETTFADTSTAGDATITNNGATASNAHGGQTGFFYNSTAGSATIINKGGAVSGAYGGRTEFFAYYGDPTAGSATIINDGGAVSGAYGGLTDFSSFNGTPTAGGAILVANGGSNGGQGGMISFQGNSTGGTSRVEVFGSGSLDISGHDFPGVTIGSIEGDGDVFLGANKLAVGSNNLSTTFSGVIQDTGSLTKVGQGTLILTNANTYAGGTTIQNGTLVVNNLSGSGTGTGAVQVNAGVLGGRGTISGAVTVGTGSGRRAMLDPGRPGTNKPGHFLSILSALILDSDATYNVGLNATDQTVDQVMANGVTINGAQFHFAVHGRHVLSPGTVFTVIANTAATPIAGAFSNLPDGSLITANGHTFQASYEGGDGNDLTLTVVP